MGKGWSIERFTCRQGIERVQVVKGAKPTAMRKFRSRSEAEDWLRDAARTFGLNPAWSGLPGMAWKEGWVDNPASRQLHNGRMVEWLDSVRKVRSQQAQDQLLSLPVTPDGSTPEIMLQDGRFRAYRFQMPGASEAEWQYDAGSGRIDAALERHFLEGLS